MKFAKELTERFLRYVAIPTESNGRAGVVPSSEGQRELARLLEAELREMTDTVIKKLTAMSDAEYAELELFPDFDKEDADGK